MKIFQINANYGFGSTGIIVKDIQSICLQNGIDCEVAYSMSKGPIKMHIKLGIQSVINYMLCYHESLGNKVIFLS